MNLLKIKRILSLLIIFFSLITISHAQAYYQFIGGYNLSQTKLTADHALDVDKIPGFHVGISFRMLFEENFYVQTELLFTKKGYLSGVSVFIWK